VSSKLFRSCQMMLKRRTQRPQGKPRRTLLKLELLETRLAPATVTWVAGHSIAWAISPAATPTPGAIPLTG
jgi:hypothetical protein